MNSYLLVGLGGMLGSVSRYACSAYFLHAYPAARFPWGTFFVNIAGCLLIGIIASLCERLTSFNSEIRLALITGFLGGFTTFSAFGLETIYLLREGALLTAVLYVLGSVILGAVCVYAGLKI